VGSQIMLQLGDTVLPFGAPIVVAPDLRRLGGTTGYKKAERIAARRSICVPRWREFRGFVRELPRTVDGGGAAYHFGGTKVGHAAIRSTRQGKGDSILGTRAHL
jgi:hypothetical protein